MSAMNESLDIDHIYEDDDFGMILVKFILFHCSMASCDAPASVSSDLELLQANRLVSVLDQWLLHSDMEDWTIYTRHISDDLRARMLTASIRMKAFRDPGKDER